MLALLFLFVKLALWKRTTLIENFLKEIDISELSRVDNRSFLLQLHALSKCAALIGLFFEALIIETLIQASFEDPCEPSLVLLGFGLIRQDRQYVSRGGLICHSISLLRSKGVRVLFWTATDCCLGARKLLL